MAEPVPARLGALAAALIAACLIMAEVRTGIESVRGRRARRAREAVPRKVSSGSGARPWLLVMGAAAGAAVLMGGLPGVVAGAFTGVTVRRWLARRQAAAAADHVARPDPSRLPLCADLMAACLAAGATPGEAAGAVGGCLGGPLGDALLRTRAELRLGGEPEECWKRFGELSGAAAIGRCLARASTTGAAPVAEMTRLASDSRAGQAREALGRARKAAVLATGPLGLCFLPAFLLVGVAPVVIGLAGTVLGGAMG
ncbi:type II secretion system F family protein [Actinacidiphila yeochonensis]|uniref:type II secretion system F family protein n=1 Tax=Actinacidiphila yeochonensis TaxID=89050 RepID=UPI00056383BC|nr:type II secretion system F family protein [Actinacidiphila yeochonensis]